MKTTIEHLVLAAVLAGGSMGAQAGVLSYQGVTFTSSWSGKVLTLEIDAAGRNGDWTGAKGLAALELDGIGNYSAVSVAGAPGGTNAWNTSSSELTAKGCSGGTNGQAGSRLCFFGQQIALGDNMVFSFSFAGDAIKAVDPHVKVEFVNAKGKKVGSLLSQTLPASPGSGSNPGSNPGSNTGSNTGSNSGSGSQSGGGSTTAPGTPTTGGTTPTAPATPTTPSTPSTPDTTASTPGTPAVPVSTTPPAPSTPAIPPVPSGDTTAGGGNTIVDIPVKEIPPTASLPTELPVTNLPTNTEAGGGAGSGKAEVPEPQSIALLLGGIGLMGLALRRKPRN